MARKVNNEWVQIIKDKTLQQPNLISTILPVLVDPCQVKEVQEFRCESISSYTLWTIGRNHLRSALQELAKEATLNDLRNIHIRLYCGPKEEQALQLGNIHNGSQQALKPKFQDCINQALKLKKSESLSTQVTQMLRDVEMREVPKESVGTICSILRYSEENLKMVKKLFTQFAQRSGSMKSIPQTIAFTGVENGRILLRSLFSAKNDFSNMLNLESNTLFITSVYDRAGECIPAIPGCSRKRKATKPLEDVDVEEGNDEGVYKYVQTVEEKFVGKFELDILSIYQTPEQFLCRPLKQQWVDYLKIKLLNSKSQTTIFPLLLDPECVSKKENFDASVFTTYRYYALGGNHFTGALRHLIESGENVNYRKLQARVYVGLTSEEARIVGNLHNKSSSTVLKLNFQDKVFQARQIRKETGDSNLRKKLEEALCCLGNEMSKDSMSTVLSVARYTDENYQMFLQIVHSFEFEEGLEKSLPQNLFRILQGLNKETVTLALQKSKTEGLKKGLEWLKIEKNLSVLKTAFVNQTDSQNWESAKSLFPQESSRLRDFADVTLKKKSLPTGFVEFCSQARDPLMHPTQFTVNFDIKINKKTCSGNTVESIICKYKKKIIIELEKNKNNIIAEHFEQTSVDSLCTQSDSTIDTLDNTQVSMSDTQITHIPETQMSLNLSEQ